MTKNTKRGAAAVFFLLLIGLGIWWWAGREPAELPPAKTLDEVKDRLVAATRSSKDQASLEKVIEKTLNVDGGGMMGVFLKNYASMTPEQKKTFLDKQIDSSPPPPTYSTTIPTTGPGAPRMVVRKSNGGDKSMMEAFDPGLRAMLADYARDLNNRRKERGLPPGPVSINISVNAGNNGPPAISFGPGPK